MNVESEAIKVLAESLVKAYGKVVEQNNKTYVNNQIKNYPGGTGIGGGGGGSYSGSINVSQIRGFADGVVNAVSANFETVTADTGVFNNLYAQYAEFTRMVSEKISAGTVDAEVIYSELAKIGLANIGTANIDVGQIKYLSTDTAFVRQDVTGKSYIDTLAVSESNIVNLAVGNLMINDENGNLVRIKVDSSGNVVVDQEGNVETDPYKLTGDDVLEQLSVGNELISSVHGSKIIAQSVTTEQLNASEIFAKNAVIMDLIADNINAIKLFANEGFIPTLTTTIIQSNSIGENLDISNNASIELTNERIESVVSNNNRKTATYVQVDPPQDANAGDVWFNPTQSYYYVAKGAVGKNAPTFAYDDEGNLLYSFREEADEEYDLTVDENGMLNIDDPDYDPSDPLRGGYSIVDDKFTVDVNWTKIENQAFSQVSQTASKIEWIVASGESASDMQLTDEALGVIANNIDLTANESIRLVSQTVAIEAVNTLIRVDENGLHVGEVDSNKEVLIDDESMSINIGGQAYSKFASNYAQFGNYRIYNDNSGGLVFKMM